MKRCASCDRVLSEKITTCPACGSRQSAGLTHIDGYRILAIIHEGRSSLVCKVVKEDGTPPLTIRLFTDESGVDETVAKRLENELNELKQLPESHFVQHYAIRKSSNGQYYRISEWVDADNWGTVFTSGLLNRQQDLVVLFRNIARALDTLHRHDHFMPYLILEDILIPKNRKIDLAVKINYKLSRFLNARATHHGPMLKKLLGCHPDIKNRRAIDFRTGIWSLGKIFVELLTANPNVTDFSSQIDKLPGIDAKLAVLIKVMLSEDPDLRPQTMSRVAQALDGILKRMAKKPAAQSVYKGKPGRFRELNLWKRAALALSFIVICLVAVNTVFHRSRETPKGREEKFQEFVESYADAIGFLMVEYWLKDSGNQLVYKNNVEGTAFLVDREGYLLTNRHVACPWLEDPSLFRTFHQYRIMGKTLDMGYRMFFWFEGEKAFNRLPDLKHSVDLSDSYYLPSAFRTDGKSDLRIAGVPRSSDAAGEFIRSPFKHDFAILKIDGTPQGLTPLPLETDRDAVGIRRLSPVIILGFPLGNRTQDDRVNASITRGHVRRTSKDIIQVDSSIYKGNSGGPAVDERGRVIGIASGVVTDQPNVMIPINTPLSDFGLVLPISEPARFLAHLKTGAPKWNGMLDFSVEDKLKKASNLAMDHEYKAAALLTDTFVKNSNEPALLFASGIFHFCDNNFDVSQDRLRQLIFVEGKNVTAQLLLFISDWLAGADHNADFTAPLFTITWEDENEYSGYLATVLKENQLLRPHFTDFENRSEQAWRYFIDGLVLEKAGRIDGALQRFRQAILWSGASDYLYFLAFSRLNRILEKTAPTPENFHAAKDKIRAFRDEALAARKKARQTQEEITGLIGKFESNDTDYDDKLDIYHQLRKIMPENKTITGRMAFFHAMYGNWDKALGFIDQFFTDSVRETAMGLSLGLLKGELLHLLGRDQAALDHFALFRARTRDDWYGRLCRLFASPIKGEDVQKLTAAAGQAPAKLITLHTALGLWAEGDNERERAAHHYREALSTYLTGWNEYDLALNRIMEFRKTPE